MVQVTVTMYECDVCGERGERYSVSYPDGTMTLDRCENHNRKLLSLKDEKGSWNTGAPGKTVFKVSTPEDIARQKKTPGS